jgi:hypothetical protein
MVEIPEPVCNGRVHRLEKSSRLKTNRDSSTKRGPREQLFLRTVDRFATQRPSPLPTAEPVRGT